MRIKYGTRGMATLFTAGSVMGAGIALLVAPQSGRKTRQDIWHFGKMARNKSRKVQLKVRRSIGNLAEGVAEKLEELEEKAVQGRRWTTKTMQDLKQVLSKVVHP